VFAVAYQRGGNAQSVDLTQPLFWLYVAIFLINWGLALFVFRKLNRERKSVRNLIAADGFPFKFNWKPALLMFVVFNGIWILYVALYAWLKGQWPSYSGLEMWQKIIFIRLFPISAGFTEEWFWRASSSPKWNQSGNPPSGLFCFQTLDLRSYMASSCLTNRLPRSCSDWSLVITTPVKENFCR
jgi:membrane protease YdiL (CAAX protease family)